MNEIANAVRVVNTAFKTVRAMEMIKKIVVAATVTSCCVFAVRFWRR